MNYVWEALLKADKQKLNRKELKFVRAEISSPYMEIASEDLNSKLLPENSVIEVNECYRFYEIFKDLFNINVQESKELREVLLDIVLNYLGELDLKSGLSKTEFYKLFLMKEIENSGFGEKLAKSINCFEKEELDTFLNGLITLDRARVSLQLFNKTLRNIFKKSIVYSNKENPKRIYIYLDEVGTKKREKKIEIIVDTFLPIEMKPFIFWKQHFGIIGLDNTMKNGEIIIVE